MKKILNKISKRIDEINQAKEASQIKKNLGIDHKRRGLLEKDGEVQKIELDVSSWTIIKILFVVAIFWTLKNIFVELQSIVVISAITFFLAMGLAPILSKIESFRVPRPLAILILYAIFFGFLGIIFVAVLPILATQLLDIAYDLRYFVQNGKWDIPMLQPVLDMVQFDPAETQEFLTKHLADISENLQSIAGSTFGILASVFQGVFNLIYALVLMFFILLEREQIARFVLSLFPSRDRTYIVTKFSSVQTKMAEWFRGQFILMIAMGVFVYAGMKVLEMTMGMKYAATIGLVAGVMELFPYIGVFVTTVLALLIAVNIDIWLLVAVGIWLAIAQFLEGNFLIPMIMEKVVGLSSVVTILAISIGGILGSAIGGVPLAVLGMILAIPIAASVAIFVEDYAHREK